MYPHASADVEIRLINADGSAAEISGNGTRCVAAYISSSQQKDRITIQTGAGPKLCTLSSRTQADYVFEVEMGEAFVGAELALKTNAEEIRGIPVSMGNPHFVVFMPALFENWQLRAAAIQRGPGFEQGVNVEFVVIDGQHDITVRFFERGVGETQSSGTGSCASAIAAIAAGKAKSPVRVHSLGGTQTVRQENNALFLRGTARLVCRGEFFVS
jgi:diaminopimelate epimerase